MTQPDLDDEVIVITGGNSGIGTEAAIALASMGATVVITARDPGRGAAALAEIHERSGASTAEVMALDLGDFASIRTFSEAFLERYDRLDVLINNAGGILSGRRVTEQGFEMTFGVNHLGHFLLTDLLLDRLKESAPSRVVNVASLAHRMTRGLNHDDLNSELSYNTSSVYNDSKLANVLFTRELARRLDGTGVTVNCCHPGPVRTGFGAGADTKGVEKLMLLVARPFMIGPKRGSVPLVVLASSPELKSVTGEYFSRRPMSGFPGAKVKAHPAGRAGRDDKSAARLWDQSVEMVGSVPT